MRQPTLYSIRIADVNWMDKNPFNELKDALVNTWPDSSRQTTIVTPA